MTLVVIPTTILLTLFAANLMGYTINRVSLFALIFSIGILVDDAIVDGGEHRAPLGDARTAVRACTAAIEAVAEVGNPTIVATLTVVAALLPMLFVSGLMGPYMAPIPANASAAMLFSFFVAVVVAPWLMLRLAPRTDAAAAHGGGRASRGPARAHLPHGRRADRCARGAMPGSSCSRSASPPRGLLAVLLRAGHREAAAVRQQVGARGRARPAAGREPRGHRADPVRGRRHRPRAAGSDVGPDLCGNAGAVQFQRAGAALLFARSPRSSAISRSTWRRGRHAAAPATPSRSICAAGCRA